MGDLLPPAPERFQLDFLHRLNYRLFYLRPNKKVLAQEGDMILLPCASANLCHSPFLSASKETDHSPLFSPARLRASPGHPTLPLFASILPEIPIVTTSPTQNREQFPLYRSPSARPPGMWRVDGALSLFLAVLLHSKPMFVFQFPFYLSSQTSSSQSQV